MLHLLLKPGQNHKRSDLFMEDLRQGMGAALHMVNQDHLHCAVVGLAVNGIEVLDDALERVIIAQRLVRSSC
jgi:hypothetical protein